ncbi:MAG: hypothetical protein AVDCRST_MAG93-5534 [uncultured Chloroflexia bacterium]|uniref:Uncharacterized protein n=1 Tax=uncultured Chloroflexia bacterium TaxID=1672391 RepID=A0A6J4L170_9CHLR|nr:MAG: hypothetical protein AVDCRST_MAG93-5534 [uncultured Chloroflexia bacterium]
MLFHLQQVSIALQLMRRTKRRRTNLRQTRFIVQQSKAHSLWSYS